MRTTTDKSIRTKKSSVHRRPDDLDISKFIEDLDEKMLNRSWWKEMKDISNKDPIIHNNGEADIEFINTRHGAIGM